MNPLHNRLVAHLLAAFAVAGQGDASDHDGEALAIGNRSRPAGEDATD